MKTIKEQLQQLERKVLPSGVIQYMHYDEEHDVVLDFFQRKDEKSIKVKIHSDNFFANSTIVEPEEEINLNDIVNNGNIY